MEENNANNDYNVNQMFDNYATKIEIKREKIRNGEEYIDPDEQMQLEKAKEKIHLENDNFFKYEIETLQNKLKTTKFKNRLDVSMDFDKQKIKFLLDGRNIMQLDYTAFAFNYNHGDLVNEVIKELYLQENAYTLISFVTECCYVSDKILKPKFRTSTTDFIDNYIKHTQEKFGSKALTNLHNISKLMEIYYGDKKVKYENTWYFSKVTLNVLKPSEYNNNNIVTYNVDDSKIFDDFIKTFFEITHYVEPGKRIKRSDFFKLYNYYIEQNYTVEYKMKLYQLKEILAIKYDETFIKSNGIWYLRRLKLKDFK